MDDITRVFVHRYDDTAGRQRDAAGVHADVGRWRHRRQQQCRHAVAKASATTQRSIRREWRHKHCCFVFPSLRVGCVTKMKFCWWPTHVRQSSGLQSAVNGNTVSDSSYTSGAPSVDALASSSQYPLYLQVCRHCLRVKHAPVARSGSLQHAHRGRSVGHCNTRIGADQWVTATRASGQISGSLQHAHSAVMHQVLLECMALLGAWFADVFVVLLDRPYIRINSIQSHSNVAF